MELRYITSGAVETGGRNDLAAWRQRTDGFLWLHVDACDDDTARLLRDGFGFHAAAVEECRQRSTCRRSTATPIIGSSSCTVRSSAGRATSTCCSSGSSSAATRW